MKIIVVAGGFSKERAVSLITGREVFQGLNKNEYDVSFFDLKNIKDLKYFETLKLSDGILIFNALHGTFGEDGQFQKFLDNLKIRYTGSGFESSFLCMNKLETKKKWKNVALTPRYKVWQKSKAMKMPFGKCVVKPNSQGSSVGVSIVNSAKELYSAIMLANKYDKKVIVEEHIEGREISIPVIGNKEGVKCLPVIEIIPLKNEVFYSYKSKYEEGWSKHIIPAEFDKNMYKKIEDTALRVYQESKCEVYARVDMIIRGEDIFVLEVNTLPGMTPTSLFPQSAKAFGLSFSNLLSEIIKLSLQKL